VIADWLRQLGLEYYEAVFRDNKIDAAILPSLTSEDLKDLGIAAVGDRRRLLNAIAELRGAPAQTQTPAPAGVRASVPPLMLQDTAERRQLTVMFCDLVGSTTLSTRLDPEDLRAVINAYHRCATELVERHGGFVAKYMGDGVLAYFGYPRAEEHDAEQAVRSALAVVEAVPKLTTTAGSALQVRVGIATGLVVVGDLIGAGAAQEQAVVGETPNLAARLQALAEPGAVVISGTTRQLTGGLFEYRDLGPIVLKGFAEGMPAWQVLGAGAAESRFEALRASSTPLVGREEEIDLLLRRWEQAKRGDGQVVLISGEPGIGKSRIAQTLVERLAGAPHTRLRYFCSPHHQDSALYPIITQLERAAGFRREDTAEQQLDKLETVLTQATKDLNEAAPLLADLLSIPSGDRYSSITLTPQKRKEKTLRVLLSQVEGLASRQPLLIVIEDAHWIDPTTRESLDLIIDRVPTLRVLVIITCRPEFTSPWIGRPHVSFVTLNRLPLRQRAEMIAHVTDGKTLPKEIAVQIIDRTDGVPLFIEELTKTVVESGILAEAGDQYELTGPATPLAIPTSLHASLLARLDRLGSTREVAQIGAALGRSFSHELLGAVAAMPQHKIDDALDQLVRAELIFRRGIPPDAEYTFKHALVQDAAYGTLMRNRRQQIHARIVATVESQFAEIVTAQPALIAHHCTEAGLIAKAVDYRLKAGQQATARSAMMEAEGHLRRGLDLLAGMTDTAQSHHYELELQTALGMTLIATHGYDAPAVAEAFARARQLCEQLDRPSELAVLLVGQCTHHLLAGESLLACQESDELLNLGLTRNDADLRFQGSAIGAAAWFHAGQFRAAHEHAEQALSLYDPAYPSLTRWPQDPCVLALAFAFRSLTYLGYLDQARKRRDEALTQARQRAHAHTLAMVLVLSMEIEYYMQTEAEILLRRAEESMKHAVEHGFPYWIRASQSYRWNALSALGHTEQAAEVLAEALASAEAALGKSFTTRPHRITSLANILGKAGRPNEGLQRLNSAVSQIKQTHERWSEAELYRVRGELIAATGDLAAAEQSFRSAMALAHNQSAKLWELRAASSLARLWRDQGKCTKARDLLASVYKWFTEGFDTPVLKEAKALLEELAA
jgi:class 3 adenylate cyclase/tetratricopeptide (TPR) repeat protein